MTLQQSQMLLEAVNRADARRLCDAAFAARMATADGKDWLKFVREVTHGD